MDPGKDYYKALGVPEGASAEEIRKSFRRMAKKFHPDVNPGDKAAEARFKEINEAHGVLSDPKKRAEYDAIRKGAFQGAGGPGSRRSWTFGEGIDPGDVFSRSGGFGDILGDLLRGGSAGFEGSPAKGRDVTMELPVDFLDMARGAVREVRYRRPSQCPRCGGTGRSGRKGCPGCYGSGRTEESESVKVRIPAGARDGSSIRVQGKGEGVPPPRAAGDLIIRLKTVPHPFFRREGNDIFIDLPVHFSEAVRGAKISVPTIDGPVTLSVPPGSSGGRRLRLKGRGVPAPEGGKRGDQYVVLSVVVPKERSEEFLGLVEGISAFEDPNLRGGWN